MPTVLAAGVIGKLNVVVLLGETLLKGPAVMQVIVCPLVVQVVPATGVNVAGALKPVGNVIVLVIAPASGAVPEFVNVTGTLLGEPATNGVNGCPMLTETFGAGAATTGVVGVIGGAVLSAVTVSPGTGVVAAVNGLGEVPTVLAAGVTGIFKTTVFVGAVLLIGPGVEHVTI